MFSTIKPVNLNKFTTLCNQIGDLLYSHQLVSDSRLANSQSIFCAYPGTALDGRNYIQDAINKNTRFIVWEDGIKFDYKVANYGVANLRSYIGILANYKFNYASNLYKTIGVTGTNGKTSITFWLNQVYTKLGQLTGIIGTTGYGIYPQLTPLNNTTPDPIILSNILHNFADNKVQMVAMEVSSHALSQDRINGVYFDSVIFTNLTQDHLDYHHDMENYYQAKKLLFYWTNLKNIIINIDDVYGQRLYQEVSTNQLASPSPKIVTYGFNQGDVRACDIQLSLAGTTFNLCYGNETIHCSVNVIGKFNIYNLLAVITILILDGNTLATIASLLSVITPVTGRMELIKKSNQPLVVVDYCHTPDSLEQALKTLKEIKQCAKLYCVFGCGGNRDNSKRALMGKIATTIADYVIITADNPRFEEQQQITAQILSGVNSMNVKIIESRHDAIKYALQTAKADDIVLIAGKGHENYQEIRGIKYPLSDIAIANQLLNDT
jgi:UDP-N-acetylmuramyl-tripeptide synthetase